MALGTITRVDSTTWGNRKIRIVDIQLTSGANYTTGGETVTARSVGLTRIIGANPLGNATTSSGTTSRTIVFLYGNGTSTSKLLTQTTGSAEAAGSSDQSTFTQRMQFIGY